MAQFARPDADVTVTGWVEDDDTSVNMWDEINESVASDTDYVKSPTPPGSNEYEAGLTDVTDPVASTGHIMRWRRRAPVASGAAINLTVRLLQTTTQIKSVADNSIPSTFTDTSATLSGGEADAITDYTALRMEFVAAQV